MSEQRFDPDRYRNEETGMFEYPEIGNLEAAKAQIAAAPIEFKVESPDFLPETTLSLPYDCVLTYSLIDPEDDGRTTLLDFHWVRVPPSLRGSGIGERMMQACIANAKDQGALSMESAVTNQAGMRIRQKYFAEEDHEIRDYPRREDRSLTPLPLTVEQAINSLVRSEKFEANPDEREQGFLVITDLKNLDVTGWERPSARFEPGTSQ